VVDDPEQLLFSPSIQYCRNDLICSLKIKSMPCNGNKRLLGLGNVVELSGVAIWNILDGMYMKRRRRTLLLETIRIL
jgi:hypothetical protein